LGFFFPNRESDVLLGLCFVFSITFASNEKPSFQLTSLMKDQLRFQYLPDYADFLIQNKVKDFTIEQLKYFRELNVPILKYFTGIPDSQLIEQGLDGTKLFLEAFKQNDVKNFIEKSIADWLSNQIPMITREKIRPEDLTLISFVRRKLFRTFLPFYTSDLHLSLKIMDEFDTFTVELDTLCFQHLLDIHRKLYEQAEALAHIGNWSMDLKTNQVIWSDEMFRIYGLEPVDNAGIYDLRSFRHPEDNALIEEQIEHSIREKVPNDFYYRIILKNGKIKHVHAMGKPEVVNGVVVKMFGTLQDVTHQKQMEEDLKKSELLYHGMINEIQDYAIILLNREGIIMNWNKGAEKIKGYSASEIVGKHIREFYIKEDQNNKLPEKLLSLAASQGKATHEGWRTRKDGTTFWGSIVITAIHDEHGNVTGFSKITRELTERKLAEDRLIQFADNIERKNKKLEQANKELESFSYIASHDLQEPLRKIQAFTSRLLQKENDNLSEWGKEVFAKVQNSANRMQRLIEALLSFSRLDKTQELFEHTDINHLLEETKHNLHEVIESKHAIIQSDHLPLMNVIPIQFQQLLTNLINNAIKYSKSEVNPFIQITYGIKEGKNIIGNSPHDKNKYHHICIIDNGIGFDQQYSDKIFELFQRLHGKSEYEGTGIGLAICKKIVDNHHGFINAKGEPGKGAEFNIYIPTERRVEIVEPQNPVAHE
jgi:PAS domain S-box-containing protein